MGKKTVAACLSAAGLIALGLSFASPGFAEPPQNKSQAVDNRELLPLPFETRNMLLHKMNNENLGHLGRMLDALSRDDLAEVARLANDLTYSEKTKKGSRQRGSVTFAVLSADFHGQKAPAIRQAAEKGDRREVLQRMSEAVTACMACHAATRLSEWPDNRAYTTPAPVNYPEGMPQPQYQIPNYQYPSGSGARP
jgi:hypothetical protein